MIAANLKHHALIGKYANLICLLFSVILNRHFSTLPKTYSFPLDPEVIYYASNLKRHDFDNQILETNF